MGAGYQPSAQPPTWRTRGSFFVWFLPVNLFGMGDLPGALGSSRHGSKGHWNTQATSPLQGDDPCDTSYIKHAKINFDNNSEPQNSKL